MADADGGPRGRAGARGLGRRGRPHGQLWFAEAVELIRLRRTGRAEEARRRINEGLSENRFNAFRAEHARLLEEIENVRVAGLADNDRRRQLTFYSIVAAALLTLLMVAIASRQLWRRVGGPVSLLSAGVGRVTRGRLSDPIPPSREAVARARGADGGLQPDAERGAPGARRGHRGRPARGGAEDRARAVGDGSERPPARAPALGARAAAGRPLPPGRARPARRRRLLRRPAPARRPPGGDGRRHGRPRRARGGPGRRAAIRLADAGVGQPEPGGGAGGAQRADGRRPTSAPRACSRRSSTC